MTKILIAGWIIMAGLFANSIYNLKYTSIEGSEINMVRFKGKKILLVNIASESPYAAKQLPELEVLQSQFKDSLSVIAFPSNDFGHEPRSNEEIKQLMYLTYHVSFALAQKSIVRDSLPATHPLYHWLQHKSENGVTSVRINEDFRKILIDGDGNIIGVFAGSTNPLASSIINSINQ